MPGLASRHTPQVWVCLLEAVGVDDVDADRLTASQRTHDGAQGAGGATGATDHATEVLRVDADLEDLTAAQLLAPDGDGVLVVDDPLDEVLERLLEHAQASAFADSSAGVSTASCALGSSTLGSSAFFSAFFFGVVAPSFGSSIAFLAAASKAAFLSALGSATFRVPSAPGRPLNFCQSPVTFSSASTCSVGCAPTESQYCARSELMSISDGCSVGWYLPISSIAWPSRLARESMTTTR